MCVCVSLSVYICESIARSLVEHLLLFGGAAKASCHRPRPRWGDSAAPADPKWLKPFWLGSPKRALGPKYILRPCRSDGWFAILWRWGSTALVPSCRGRNMSKKSVQMVVEILQKSNTAKHFREKYDAPQVPTTTRDAPQVPHKSPTSPRDDFLKQRRPDKGCNSAP